jgi:hypothetical protein
MQVRRGAAVLAILVLVTTPVAYAEEGWPYEPPQGRISPPIGGSAQDSADSLLKQFLTWLQGRISPPIG